MSQELFNDGSHICVVFRDLVTGEAVQSNQVLIFDHNHAALIDPGGDLTYTLLFMGISNYMNDQMECGVDLITQDAYRVPGS